MQIISCLGPELCLHFPFSVLGIFFLNKFFMFHAVVFQSFPYCPYLDRWKPFMSSHACHLRQMHRSFLTCLLCEASAWNYLFHLLSLHSQIPMHALLVSRIPLSLTYIKKFLASHHGGDHSLHHVIHTMTTSELRSARNISLLCATTSNPNPDRLHPAFLVRWLGGF